MFTFALNNIPPYTISMKSILININNYKTSISLNIILTCVCLPIGINLILVIALYFTLIWNSHHFFCNFLRPVKWRLVFIFCWYSCQWMLSSLMEKESRRNRNLISFYHPKLYHLIFDFHPSTATRQRFPTWYPNSCLTVVMNWLW